MTFHNLYSISECHEVAMTNLREYADCTVPPIFRTRIATCLSVPSMIQAP